MRKSLLLIALATSLSACGAHNNQTPVMAQFKPQYCHTESNYTLKDGDTASSVVNVECDDNPANKHFLAYSGLAESCREHYYDVWYNGKQHRQRGFVCQKPNGRWEIVNHPYN